MDGISLNSELCAICAGACCRLTPGYYTDPSRVLKLFFNDVIPETLGHFSDVLMSQGVVLDVVDGVSLPRPERVDGGCRFRGLTGCEKGVGERPEQCLSMVPVMETIMLGSVRCEVPSSFDDSVAVIAWSEFYRAQGWSFSADCLVGP